MAIPRVLSRGRSLLPKVFTPSTARVTYSAITLNRAPLLQQNFSSSIPARDDAVQTTSKEPEIAPPGSINARGVAMLNIPKRATKADVKEALRSKGFDAKNISLRLDKFTFQNDTKCYIELGSEEEAARALKELQEHDKLKKNNTVTVPLKADFLWNPEGKQRGNDNAPYGSRYFQEERNAAREAIRPLVEGRRYMLSVQTPGWTKDKVSIQIQNAYRIIQKTFEKYGVETIGAISPFYGDKKAVPRLLCFLDFTTKAGAENAVRDHHSTEIEGRLTWLQPSKPVSWRAHQIGKVDQELLADLQEKGVLPQEVHEDKFVSPIQK